MERIGKTSAGHVLQIDPARLVDTRALIQGSSGSGKSWLIRLIVEKVAAKIPVLILDLEGEFATLREKFDFVLAGEGGEVGVDVRSAGLFARKLLELKLSGVVSLYDLASPQKRAYVRAFLESIMAAPRALWAPRLIVLDEAHVFAPEGGQSESAAAVIDVASRGRKRGYCLVAATQRLSKLDKDVAAELRNVFVGQTTLDVDVKRALDVLGFPADLEHKRELRSLDHQFYAFGPATSAEGVVLFQADDVKTTHPESGLRRSLSPPEPSKAIQRVLGELADLPKQAEEEATTMADSKKRIRELERQLSSKTPVVDEESIERAKTQGKAEADKEWRPKFQALEKANGTLAKRLEQIAKLAHLNGEVPKVEPPVVHTPVHNPRTIRQTAPKSTEKPASTIDGEFTPNKTQQRILDTLAWYESIGQPSPTLTKIGAVAKIDPTGGHFSNTVGPLSTNGLIERGDGCITLTEAGRAVATPIEAAGTLSEFHEVLKARVRKMKSAGGKTIEMLDTIIAASGESLNVEEIGQAVGIDHTGGHFSNMIGPLSTAGLITRKGGIVTPTDVLFPEGLY